MNTAHPFAHERPIADRCWPRFLACCFVAMVAFRMFLIQGGAASIPFVDDWEATGRSVLAAWKHGTFTWQALFAAHLDDHRIVFTRLWEILWFTLNGAWDPKLVMLMKSSVYGAASILFVLLLTSGLPRHRYAAAAILTGLFTVPFGYMNMLWSFQSQFDFFLLSAAAGWLALLRGRTVLAIAIALLAPFTLAAGPIVAASYLAYFAVVGWQRTWPVRRAAIYGIFCAAIVVGGILLRVAQPPPHTLGEKSFALLNLLGWPYSNLALQFCRLPETTHLFPATLLRFPSPQHNIVYGVSGLFDAHPWTFIAVATSLAVLMVAPLLLLAARVRASRQMSRSTWGVLAVASFGGLMQAATALARAGEMTVQARYLDVVALIGFASIAAAFILAFEQGRYRRVLLIWALVVAPGYLITSAISVNRTRHTKQEQWVTTIRQYWVTRDRTKLPTNPDWQLPILVQPMELADYLDDPKVADILPLSITAPERDPRPLAATVERIASVGWLIALGAAAGAAWFAFASTRQRREFQVGAEVEIASAADL